MIEPGMTSMRRRHAICVHAMQCDAHPGKKLIRLVSPAVNLWPCDFDGRPGSRGDPCTRWAINATADHRRGPIAAREGGASKSYDS